MKELYLHRKPHKFVTNNITKDWHNKSYPGYLHMIFMQGIHSGVFYGNKFSKLAPKSGYTFQSNNQMDWFWDSRDLKKTRKIFLEKAKDGSSFYMNFYKKWGKLFFKMIDTYTLAEKIDFSKLSDKELYRWYEKLYEVNIKQGAVGYVADFSLSHGNEDWLTNFIILRLGQNKMINEIIKTLTLPVIPSYSNEESISLFKILKKINRKFSNFEEFYTYIKNNKKIFSLLNKHINKFYWIENNYFAKDLDEKYFVLKLFEHLNNNFKNPKLIISKNKKEKIILLKKLKDPYLSNVIHMMEIMTHIQDYRKMGLVRFSYFLNLIFIEIAKRSNLQVEDLHNSVEPEIKEILLEKKDYNKILNSRKNLNFVYGTTKYFTVYNEKETKKYVDKNLFRDLSQNANDLRGVPAFHGIVKGMVRIVKNAHYDDFNKGEVLVTNNTTPEFVPLMKKASAIITEQGGITTHAAIVARELKIPCIIGIKMATHVLKTGDLIEVDANKGLVRKI
jgi:phosphoenolpyruvate synthase/pyruvate phosphate dikinase